MLLEMLWDEVITVADAVAAVATATGVTVPVSTTAAATTRDRSMKTSVADAMATRRERIAIGKGKKEGAVLGRPLIYASSMSWCDCVGVLLLHWPTAKHDERRTNTPTLSLKQGAASRPHAHTKAHRHHTYRPLSKP